MTKNAENQRNYAKNNIAKGLCAQCTNPLAIGSIRFCRYHLDLKKTRGKTYAQSPRSRSARLILYEKTRREVIHGMGGECECCRERIYNFLTLDHRNSDGYLDRRQLLTEFRLLIRAGFPKDKFRILCYNCNCGRAKNGGVCPHVTEDRDL